MNHPISNHLTGFIEAGFIEYARALRDCLAIFDEIEKELPISGSVIKGEFTNKISSLLVKHIEKLA